MNNDEIQSLNYGREAERYFPDVLKLLITLSTIISAYLWTVKDAVNKDDRIYLSYLFIGFISSMLISIIALVLKSFHKRQHTYQAIEKTLSEKGKILNIAFFTFGFFAIGIFFSCAIVTTFSISNLIYEVPTVAVPQTPEEAIEKVIHENVIKNGNFTSPLEKSKSWGHGLYTDIYKKQIPGLIWMNFVNADIFISVVNTVKGNALRIDHKSEKQRHKLGIMEQYINVEQGKYKFAFWAKGENLQDNALQFTTTDEWKTSLEDGGYVLEKSGSFDWQLIERYIEIKKGGKKTFTIASTEKGISYITGISLTKSDK